MRFEHLAHTGLGFRREFAEEFLSGSSCVPQFIEVAPENWIDTGGYWKKVFDAAAEKYPIYLHGLSLSLGGPDALNKNFLRKLRSFIQEYRISLYSEHLSFTQCDNAHLYDLLPMPFTADAIEHVADRIKRVQDYLGMPIAIENVSYYKTIAAAMPEEEFISTIIDRAGCLLLLDVNNVFVNATNHNYNAADFIKALPLQSVSYIHIAGHEKVAPDFIIDTHGEPVIQPVFELLNETLSLLQRTVPVLLERDFNIPKLRQLYSELQHIEQICRTHQRRHNAVA